MRMRRGYSPRRRGVVTCEKCHADLHYEYGSIAWNCRDKDLCPDCAGTEAAQRIAEKFSNGLRKITDASN